MKLKLSNTEYTTKGRERSKVRSERARAKLVTSGKVALTVWVFRETKDELRGAAKAGGFDTISDFVNATLTEKVQQAQA